jgi:hypothetical protein
LLDDKLTSDKDRLRQQLISNSVNKFTHKNIGDKMSDANHVSESHDAKLERVLSNQLRGVNTHTQGNTVMNDDLRDAVDALEAEDDIDSIDSELDSEIDEALEEPVAVKLPNLMDLVGADNTTVRVLPKIILSISYIPAGEVFDMSKRIKNVRVGDTFFSCSSFMRKGTGTKKDPFGALRQPLANFVDYMEEVSNQDIVILGKTSDVAEQTEKVRAAIETRGYELLYGNYLNSANLPIVSVPQERTVDPEDGIDIDEEVQYDALDIRRLYALSTWNNNSQQGDDTVISPVFHFNMQFPILYSQTDSDKQDKAIKSMYNAFRLLAKDKQNVEFYFGFIISAESLVDDSVRGLFDEVLNIEEDGSNPFIVVSDDYIENSIVEGADDLGVLPHSLTRQEIKGTIFAHGGSILTLKAI